MNGAKKAIGRKPTRNSVGFDESAIDFLWLGREDAMQFDGVGHEMILRFDFSGNLSGRAELVEARIQGRPSIRHSDKLNGYSG